MFWWRVRRAIAGKARSLRELVQTLRQITEERDRLRDELAVKADWYSPDDYQNLAEVLHRREIEREELRKQIEELRSQPTTPEPGTLPDAGELLQKIRVKFPKLKVALKEVEAVLETLQEP